MKKNILVIGGASVDIFIFPEESKLVTEDGKKMIEFSYGSKIPVDKVHTDIGGGGANTAVGLARHSIETTLITRIGNDINGELILKKLEKEQVNTEYIKRGKLDTGLSVIVQGNGKDRTIFTYRGTNSELKESDIPSEIIASSDYILINALYANTALLVEEILTKAAGVTPVALSLGTSEMKFLKKQLPSILPLVHTLVINEEESELLYHLLTSGTHQKHETCKSCKTPAKDIVEFLHAFGIANVGITLGPAGVVFLDEHNEYMHIPAQHAEVMNATGLGDAFYSGYLSYYLLGQNSREAVTHGINNAQSVMAHLGAQIGLLRH